VRIPNKSHWKDRKLSSWTYFCPLCKVTRRLAYQPRLSARHFVQVGLTSAVLTLLTWSWFSWKGIVSFIPLWIAFEMIFRSRMRADFLCSNCGFDPYLYLTDLDRAREGIEKHWKDLGQDLEKPQEQSKTPAKAPLTEEAPQS
jgi:hypothetical protein